MDRTQKHAFVKEFNAELASSKAMVVAHYRGLTVKQITALRRSLLAAGGSVQVAKNRLAKLAFKGTAFEPVSELMTGPTILVYGVDGITASKLSQSFADKNDQMQILGGFMDGKLLSKTDVVALSKLPTLDELRGKLVGLLQAPGAQLARVTKAYADKEAA